MNQSLDQPASARDKHLVARRAPLSSLCGKGWRPGFTPEGRRDSWESGAPSCTPTLPPTSLVWVWVTLRALGQGQQDQELPLPLRRGDTGSEMGP